MKAIAITALLTLSTSVVAMDKSLCGADNRVPSDDKKIGRLVRSLDSSLGCTATLISDRCAISAGHCAHSANFLEFNVPNSDGYGVSQHPPKKDIYAVNNIIDWENLGKGDDFVVFHLKRNEITGKFPGDVQGYYPVSFEVPEVGTPVTITGFGKSDVPSLYGAQQIAYGYVSGLEGRIVNHNIDTMQGNSGSAIINENSGEIIGVHTHGGCNYSSNKGTAISKHRRLTNAIKECLELSK